MILKNMWIILRVILYFYFLNSDEIIQIFTLIFSNLIMEIKCSVPPSTILFMTKLQHLHKNKELLKLLLFLIKGWQVRRPRSKKCYKCGKYYYLNFSLKATEINAAIQGRFF